MTMEDAVRATLELMAADGDALSIRTSYNLQGCTSPQNSWLSCMRRALSLDVLYALDTDKTSRLLGPTAWTTLARRLGLAGRPRHPGWCVPSWRDFPNLRLVEGLTAG